MSFIRDSIHGNLEINDYEKKIIDTVEVQRLRRIKQLGFTYLTYPGANHSRFEHSLGTMFLSSRLADSLNLDEYQKQIVRISALLHDIGHAPFSHVSEPLLDEPHEDYVLKIIKNSKLNDILDEKFEIKKIDDIIHGKGKLGPMISGDLDMDRMDYLIRDSHYTGVAYGKIDVERILTNLKLEKRLILDFKGVQAAEFALVARYFMYPTVYQHHTTRIANAMARRAFKEAIDLDIINIEDMYKFDDNDLISLLRKTDDDFITDFMFRLDNRRLLKNASSIGLSEFETPGDIFKIDDKKLKKAEKEISEDYGVEEGYVLIDKPQYPQFDEMNTSVSYKDELYNLNDISDIVSVLKEARFNHAELSLYSTNKEPFKKFDFKNYLDLPEKSIKKLKPTHKDQINLLDFM